MKKILIIISILLLATLFLIGPEDSTSVLGSISSPIFNQKPNHRNQDSKINPKSENRNPRNHPEEEQFSFEKITNSFNSEFEAIEDEGSGSMISSFSDLRSNFKNETQSAKESLPSLEEIKATTTDSSKKVGGNLKEGVEEVRDNISERLRKRFIDDFCRDID